MRSQRRAGRPAHLAAAVFALALSDGAHADVPALKGAMLGEGADLYLEVVINGRSIGLVAAFQLSADGVLTIAPDELAEIGLKADAAAQIAGGAIDVSRLPGVAAAYDSQAQIVRFSVNAAAQLPHVVEAQPQLSAAPEAVADPGVVLNYTVYAAGGHADGWRFEGVSALLEGRAFGPYGTVSGAVLARSDGRRWRRLETVWSYADPVGPTSYAAGDIISGALSWTRPVRLGGVQVRRNFSLRPDIVTQPLAELRGSADVPSTVEVYVDGARRVSADVPAGPFEVANLPLVTGGGTARVVVRDALGREQVSETPFYAANTMLAEGLFDFSAEIGVARLDFGSEDDRYEHTLFASASLRYGLSDALTLEGHGEGGGGLVMGGAGAVTRLGSFGALSVSGAFSRSGGETGTRFQGSVEMEFGGLRLFALSQRTSENFADIASVSSLEGSAGQIRALDQIAVSLPQMWDKGALTMSFTRLDRAAESEARIASANLSQELPGDAMIFASVFADLADDNAFGVFVGASVPLGDSMSAGASYSVDAARNALAGEIIKAESGAPGGYGWRVRVGDDVQAARGAYRADVARLEAAAWHAADGYHGTLQAEGALVLTGGGLFAATRVDDAFAVVETGTPGVEVRVENRPAGRTDADGQLLVPGLRAYQVNRVAIDPAGLPVGADVGDVARTVTPADRAGVSVDFAVRERPAAALVTLRDEAGLFIEPGAMAVLEATGEGFIVGYEGQAYVKGLSAQNRLLVSRAGGESCAARFAFARLGDEQVHLDVACLRGAVS